MSAENGNYAQHQLTCSSLLNFLCRDGKERNYSDHNLYDDVCHRRSRWDGGVNFQSFKKIFDAAEEIDERVLTSTDIDILGRLGDLSVKMRESRMTPTKSRTPIPATIVLAGENAWRGDIRTNVINRDYPDTHETNSLANCGRKGVEDVDSRDK